MKNPLHFPTALESHAILRIPHNKICRHSALFYIVSSNQCLQSALSNFSIRDTFGLHIRFDLLKLRYSLYKFPNQSILCYYFSLSFLSIFQCRIFPWCKNFVLLFRQENVRPFLAFSQRINEFIYFICYRTMFSRRFIMLGILGASQSSGFCK